MNFPDISDDAALDECNGGSIAGVGMALNPHLRIELLLLSYAPLVPTKEVKVLLLLSERETRDVVVSLDLAAATWTNSKGCV